MATAKLSYRYCVANCAVGRVAGWQVGGGELGRLTAGVGNCLLRQQLTQVGIFSSVWREICKSQAEICLSQLDRRRGRWQRGVTVAKLSLWQHTLH